MTETIKMRTMETAYQAIKEMDPDTAITRWAIRQAVSGGYIPSRADVLGTNISSIWTHYLITSM